MPPAPDEISPKQARKLALVSQRLPVSGFPRGLAGTREAIRHLGYVQIDTISVVERAHHHTLWTRVPHYRRRYLDRLLADRAIFEYWAHAAAYLPMEDFRFCLPRMHAIAGGQRHWYPRNPRLMREVLSRIRLDGPLQARDFESHRAQSAGGMWQWGPVKQAIEHLFMEGRIMVTRREKFQKIFDLTERVVPPETDTRTPSQSEYAHNLIDRYLQAHGIARLNEIGYQRKGMGAAVKRAILEKLESGEILAVKIKRIPATYYVRGDFETTLNCRLAHLRPRLLSPFDNFVIQRERVQKLFDFDYQLECYMPASKRQHGYFCLPILWRGGLVARMDAKADRKTRRFVIRQLHMETEPGDIRDLPERLYRELAAFAAFTQCDHIVLGSISPRTLKHAMQQLISRHGETRRPGALPPPGRGYCTKGTG